MKQDLSSGGTGTFQRTEVAKQAREKINDRNKKILNRIKNKILKDQDQTEQYIAMGKRKFAEGMRFRKNDPQKTKQDKEEE